MFNFLSFFYIFGGVIFGVVFSYLIFYIKMQQRFFNYLKKYANYKHAFQSISQDLERELSIRKNVEERLQDNEDILRKLYAKLAVSEERLVASELYCNKYDIIVNELRIQREVVISQEAEIKQLMFCLKEKNGEISEKKKLLSDFEQKFTEKFEFLSNRIFESYGKKIDVQNKVSLDKLLSPLRFQLDEFNQEIKKRFSKEECERHTLFYEIHNLQRLNKDMVQETINLTKALKGDNKVQGNWGEVILNRVLEASGMREGHEFHTQSSVPIDDGRRLQPDVIVHLPNNKDIIIDAKTSLLSYEKYFNSDNADDRKVALSNHINSLRSHMKLLAKKDYQSLYVGVQRFEYVLMFIPIESAFMLAINEETSLLTEAIEYNIMLVSPTTLLVALRIINNLWDFEYQNRYTKEIADRASCLYDKLRLFVDDINKIGQYLNKVQDSYGLAKRKLFEGSGNIISQAERFRLFGVKIKRPIISGKKLSSSIRNFRSDQV